MNGDGIEVGGDGNEVGGEGVAPDEDACRRWGGGKRTCGDILLFFTAAPTSFQTSDWRLR